MLLKPGLILVISLSLLSHSVSIEGHPLLCHNQPACILQRQRDWDKFEKMAAAAASRVVEKRFLTDDEFYKVPEKFYGFHDEYKRIPNFDLMRMGKRGISSQMGFNFPLRAPGMGFNGKRSETEKTEHGNDTSKLMIGMVDKRKPGMEFLGKRGEATLMLETSNSLEADKVKRPSLYLLDSIL